MRFAIVVFPGSNCDQDCEHVAKSLLGCEAEFVWHAEKDLQGADVVVIPGGTITRRMAKYGDPIVPWIAAIHPTTRYTTSVCTF